jgi:hypothetical protein
VSLAGEVAADPDRVGEVALPVLEPSGVPAPITEWPWSSASPPGNDCGRGSEDATRVCHR